MNKLRVAAFAAFSLLLTSAFAIEVNQPELQSVTGTVEFQNYNGPHSVIDSLSSIKAIGSGLGRTVASDVNKAGTFGSTNGRYYVIHCVDAKQKDKLDADIFIIGPDATVDHIRNLRYIIAAYLTSAYGYSDKDASTIATFVTVYNAVYRGKLDTFKTKYKDVVTPNLTADKCGLSTKWSDWPGQSQIVIPLSDLTGGLSTVDTSVISDKKVVQSMKEEDNKGVDERKNMVDIKEREADTATEKAQTAQKEATVQTKKAADQQKKADTAQKEADTAKKQADTAKKEADTAKKAAQEDPTNQKKQETAEKAQETADKAQDTADKKQETANQEQQKADTQKQKADESSKESTKQQEIADKKQSEAQEERTEIAKDQQKLLQDALAEQANKNAVIGLRLTDHTSEMSGMVKVDGITGETIRESPVTVIRGRTILPVMAAASTTTNTKENATVQATGSSATNMQYMAICGTNSGNETVKLCLIDGNKMEIQKSSNETIAPDSVLVQNGSDYYCVMANDSNYVVAKYDANLNLLLKSPVSVLSSTPITITPNGMIVSGANGRTLLLKMSDLTAITTEPEVPAK